MRNQNTTSDVEQLQPHRSRWLVALFAAAALAIGVASIIVFGMLEIRAEAARVGAVLDVNNVVVGVESPHRPWLITVGLAVFATIIGLALLWWVPFRQRLTALALSASFLVGAALVTVWGLATSPPTFTETLASGIEPFGPKGLEGWVQRGGASSASHIIVLLSLASFAYTAARNRRAPTVR